MNRAFLTVIIVAGIIIIFGNCNKTNTVSSSVLRVFNVGPAVKPQDIYLNGAIRVAGIAYGADTNYISILPGTYNIKIAPAGTTTYNTDYNIDFSSNRNYMMFLLNVKGVFQTEAFDESLQRLGYDTAEFRVLPFSPNAPLMDVAIKSDTASFDTTYKIYSHRYFNDVYTTRQYTQFTRITSGPYYVKFRYADTTIAFDSLLINFLPHKTYTIYTRGYFDSSGVPPFRIDTLEHN